VVGFDDDGVALSDRNKRIATGATLLEAIRHLDRRQRGGE
jgi:hypothetical protein